MRKLCKCGERIEPIKLRTKDGNVVTENPSMCHMCEHLQTHETILRLALDCGRKGIPPSKWQQ